MHAGYHPPAWCKVQQFNSTRQNRLCHYAEGDNAFARRTNIGEHLRMDYRVIFRVARMADSLSSLMK